MHGLIKIGTRIFGVKLFISSRFTCAGAKLDDDGSFLLKLTTAFDSKEGDANYNDGIDSLFNILAVVDLDFGFRHDQVGDVRLIYVAMLGNVFGLYS